MAIVAVACDCSTSIALWDASLYYMQLMLYIYARVVTCRAPNGMVAKIQLPSNVNFKEWDKIAVTSEDDLIV